MNGALVHSEKCEWCSGKCIITLAATVDTDLEDLVLISSFGTLFRLTVVFFNWAPHFGHSCGARCLVSVKLQFGQGMMLELILSLKSSLI